MGYEKKRRPLLETQSGRNLDITLSTAASTALEPRGYYGLQTAVTSSGAPVVYTLQEPKKGDQLGIVAITLVSSSQAPFHINSNAIFSAATASTGHDMVSLSTQGASFEAIALSSSQWFVTGIRGATFSTST